jgi:hypothetical protein
MLCWTCILNLLLLFGTTIACLRIGSPKHIIKTFQDTHCRRVCSNQRLLHTPTSSPQLQSHQIRRLRTTTRHPLLPNRTVARRPPTLDTRPSNLLTSSNLYRRGLSLRRNPQSKHSPQPSHILHSNSMTRTPRALKPAPPACRTNPPRRTHRSSNAIRQSSTRHNPRNLSP